MLLLKGSFEWLQQSQCNHTYKIYSSQCLYTFYGTSRENLLKKLYLIINDLFLLWLFFWPCRPIPIQCHTLYTLQIKEVAYQYSWYCQVFTHPNHHNTYTQSQTTTTRTTFPTICDQCMGSMTSHRVIMTKGCEPGPTVYRLYPRRDLVCGKQDESHCIVFSLSRQLGFGFFNEQCKFWWVATTNIYKRIPIQLPYMYMCEDQLYTVCWWQWFPLSIIVIFYEHIELIHDRTKKSYL